MGHFFAKFAINSSQAETSGASKKRKLTTEDDENSSSDDESSTLKSQTTLTPTAHAATPRRKSFFRPMFFFASSSPFAKVAHKSASSNALHTSPSESSIDQLKHDLEHAKMTSFSSLLSLSSSVASLSSGSSEQIEALRTPAKKKMKSTSLYIYNTLFVNGENSDIKVQALGREWNLHKLYLCQSAYFASMFQNGSNWKESSQSCIQISIPDQNITEQSLDITLGSFYKHDIEIVPLEVIHVLACASLLSMEGLISQCACVMRENINSDSVLAYYEASLIYGVKQVEESTLKWLCQNLMSCENTIKLEQLNLQLFEKVLASSQLFLIQVETDLYSLCKKWLYCQLQTWVMQKNDFTNVYPGKNIQSIFFWKFSKKPINILFTQ